MKLFIFPLHTGDAAEWILNFRIGKLEYSEEIEKSEFERAKSRNI